MSWELVFAFEGGSTDQALFRAEVERLAREWRVRTSTSPTSTTHDCRNAANHDDSAPGECGTLDPDGCRNPDHYPASTDASRHTPNASERWIRRFGHEHG